MKSGPSLIDRFVFKCLVVIGTVVLFLPFCSAQNYVPNGSFEEFTTSCEFGTGYGYLEDWGYINCSIPPGLAHACNNPLNNGGGVPQGGLGFQYAHSGDSFIMIWTLRMNSQGGFPDGNPQMYANVNLVAPLSAGQHYCLRLWINMVDSTSYRTGALHAYLRYGIPSVCNYQDTAWDTHAAVTWDISAVDTADWTLLEGEFEASGGEVNLTIGAFQFGEEIDSVFVADHSNLLGGDLAIYYIDDVELVACTVGVDEMVGNGTVSIYPNPASDFVTIRVPTISGMMLVEIIAQDGRVVMEQEFTGDTDRLDVSTLSNGQYTLRVQSGQRVFVEKMSIMH